MLNTYTAALGLGLVTDIPSDPTGMERVWFIMLQKAENEMENNCKSTGQVSNILDLQHVHILKFDPQLHVGHRYHGIDY